MPPAGYIVDDQSYLRVWLLEIAIQRVAIFTIHMPGVDF